MKVTIIPEDSTIIKDNLVINGLDLSDFPKDIRAVWFDNGKGEVQGTNYQNEAITDVSRFQRWIDRFDEKKKFLEARVKDPYHGMTPSDSLKYMKEDYHLKANREFEEGSKKPVSTPYGSFNGGESSALSIKGAIELTEELGESVVILTDFENETKQLTPQEAREVLVAIAKDFRNKFYLKQQKKVVIKKATNPKQIKVLFGEE